jgi:hypothetical protein
MYGEVKGVGGIRRGKGRMNDILKGDELGERRFLIRSILRFFHQTNSGLPYLIVEL